MLKKVTSMLLFVLMFAFITQAQDVNKAVKMDRITGEEIGAALKGPIVPMVRHTPIELVDRGVKFMVTPMGALYGDTTQYDLQSNGTPKNIIQDRSTPTNVHIYWMEAKVPSTWTDRGGVYLFSDNLGATWNSFGRVPSTVRGGFPAISLFDNGAAVLTTHCADGGGTVRSQVYTDQAAAAGNFTRRDPGLNADGEAPIWGRVLGIGNDKVLLNASVSGGDSAYTALLTGATFAPYKVYPGDQAETYAIAKAPNGTIGQAFLGDGTDLLNTQDVFYRESNDNGATWGPAVKLYDWVLGGDSLGGLRGIDLVFTKDNKPHVTFELAKCTDAGSYYPSFPSKIMCWTPGVNGDKPVVVADSNNVPWSSNPVASAVFTPLCRPTIGTSLTDNGDTKLLFIAFNAADTTWMSQDTIAYYANYFTLSSDGGATWQKPVRMTPVTSKGKVRDYRFVSMSPTNYVDPSNDTCYIHMVTQARDTAGLVVQTGPAGVSAELVYIVGKVKYTLSDASENGVVNSFSLGQNYPNPFNPSTTIRFSIPEQSNVTLKVYDMLGREVASLLNATRAAGSHTVTFDASKLASGTYVYTLNAGSYTASKKLLLMK